VPDTDPQTTREGARGRYDPPFFACAMSSVNIFA
jgi:hypothetical protein